MKEVEEAMGGGKEMVVELRIVFFFFVSVIQKPELGRTSNKVWGMRVNQKP